MKYSYADGWRFISACAFYRTLVNINTGETVYIEN